MVIPLVEAICNVTILVHIVFTRRVTVAFFNLGVDMPTLRLLIVASSCLLLSTMGTTAQTHPAIVAWLINTTNVTGRHYINGNPTPIADTAKANCQLVQYSADYAYVRCSGIPGYVIGPYRDGNPATAVNRNYLFKLPLKPAVQTAAKSAVGLGQIGVLINGVPIYNYADARSYNNANIWHQNAIHFERAGFDCATGHPAPIMGAGGGGVTPGQYHHHQNPTAFNIAKVNMSDVCNMYLADGLYVPDSTKHGPLIGFAFDGYPIYGAYGWKTGTTTVTRITPSYRSRAITDRTTLASGVTLTAAQYGPTLEAQALGAYAEDFEFVAGSGDLDEHNGRVCITPEYPEGTYAYFATIDANGVSAYPYVIGPTYYGVVVTDNFAGQGPGAASTRVTITESVTTYVPDSTTSVQDNDSPLATATVYPNPANDVIIVQIATPLATSAQVELIDVSGRTIQKTTINQGSTMCFLDIQTVYAGVYIVRVTMGGHSLSYSVVVSE